MAQTQTDGLEVLETREWLDSLDYVLERQGPERAGRLLQMPPRQVQVDSGCLEIAVPKQDLNGKNELFCPVKSACYSSG